MYVQVLKVIIKSKKLNKKEKIKIILKGLIEEIINSYKLILKMPFLIFGIPCLLLGALFENLAHCFYTLETPFGNVISKIENNCPNFVITKQDKIKQKIITEINEKNNKTIDKNDLL